MLKLEVMMALTKAPLLEPSLASLMVYWKEQSTAMMKARL